MRTLEQRSENNVVISRKQSRYSANREEISHSLEFDQESLEY